MWREGLEVAVRCMTEVPFTGVDGTYVKMPPRNVVPKPVQKPHPPLWVACSRRETILLAAELGIGALSFAFIDPEEATKWVGDYERVLAERCHPVGLAVNAQMACVTPMMVHRSEAEAIRRGLEGGNFFGYSLGHYYGFGEHRPGRTDVWDEFQRRRAERGYSPEAEIALRQQQLRARLEGTDGSKGGLRGAIGTPEQLREYLRRYEQLGVAQIIFVMQCGNNRHEHIMEAIELFGREILPEFTERDEKHTRAREERLAPAIDAALARPRAPVPKLPDDFTIPAMARRLLDARGGQQLIDQVAGDRAVGRPAPIVGRGDES